MVAFNFKECFAAKIERGEKLNTIRRSKRCDVGDEIQLYTAQRTPKCRKIGDGICTHVFPVTIDRKKVTADGNVYRTTEALDYFARADGFRDYDDMQGWFEVMYGLPFSGWFHKWRPMVKKEAA